MSPTVQRHPLYRVLRPPPVPSACDTETMPSERCATMAQVFAVGSFPTPPRTGRRRLTVLAFSGELCVYSVGEIREVVLDVASDTVDLVIDLGEVTLMGAALLGLFVELEGRLGQVDGRLGVQRPSALARRVLEIGGLERLVVEPLRDPVVALGLDGWPSAQADA